MFLLSCFSFSFCFLVPWHEVVMTSFVLDQLPFAALVHGKWPG